MAVVLGLMGLGYALAYQGDTSADVVGWPAHKIEAAPDNISSRWTAPASSSGSLAQVVVSAITYVVDKTGGKAIRCAQKTGAERLGLLSRC
jgi:hypothetical protein